MTPAAFHDLLVLCADGSTDRYLLAAENRWTTERIEADRALTRDAITRIEASGWSYSGVSAEELLSRATGGHQRASRHFYYAPPHDAPSGHFVNGSRSRATPGSTHRGGATRLVPATRRRVIRNDSAAPAGTYILDTFDEYPSASFLVAAGSYTVQFEGSAWSRSGDAGVSVSLSIAVDGDVLATYAINRDEPAHADTDGKRRTVPVLFDTSSPLNLAALSTITLVNSGAHDQRVDGILRVIPS